MFISKAQEFRRLNAELHAKMCAIVQLGETENRDLTSEEGQEWDRMDAEYVARVAQIAQHETLEVRDREQNALDSRRAGREPGGAGAAAEEQRASVNRAFRNFCGQNPSEWDEETRTIIQNRRAALPPEVRALGLTGAAGGFTVPEDFMTELDKALLSYSGIAQAARMINTDGGAAMPWPTVNDSGNAGALLAEGNAAADDVDPTFDAITFDAYVYTSKILRVANQLLQDTAFPLESELALMLGERLGRIMNTHGTLGTGTSQPRGVVTAVIADTTPIPAAGAAALTYNDLIDLQHGVDPAYRARNPVWMMHDTILSIIKKIVDGDSRPLWSAGLAVREPDTILGHRFFINQDMDAVLQADAESILFGDFTKYVIRRVQNPVLVTLRERYAEYFQTAFVMFSRWDSDLVDAGTGPIQVLQH